MDKILEDYLNKNYELAFEKKLREETEFRDLKTLFVDIKSLQLEMRMLGFQEDTFIHISFKDNKYIAKGYIPKSTNTP